MLFDMIDTVKSSKCGEQYDAKVDENVDKRTPCPKCGSTEGRSFNNTVYSFEALVNQLPNSL
jgi:NAD-dependent SIR2 family protein deacetylase